MSEPRLGRQAHEDMREIWQSVARRNEEKADRLLDTIREAMRTHAQFPLIGRQRDDLLPGIRSFVVSDFTVVFRPVDDTIEVLRVVHGSRNLVKIVREQTEL